MNRQDDFPVCWNAVVARAQSSKTLGEIISIFAGSPQLASLPPFLRTPSISDYLVKEEAYVR